MSPREDPSGGQWWTSIQRIIYIVLFLLIYILQLFWTSRSFIFGLYICTLNSHVHDCFFGLYTCTLTLHIVFFGLYTCILSLHIMNGSVQEDERPLRCNHSFQKQHHVTKKYINPSLTQHLVWFNPSLTCHGTCRIGRKSRTRYITTKRARNMQL